MSLLFNMLFRLVIGFLPRSKHLLISWLQSPSAVILECKKIKSVTVSIISPQNEDNNICIIGRLGINQIISIKHLAKFMDYQFSSVAQSCPTLHDPMNRSTPGLPVHHQLPEFTQTHVHWVGDAIQSSHPLSSPSPPTFHLSQHQGLFQWVSSLHQVVKVLEFQLQHQSPTKRSLEIPEKGKAEISSFQ